jgi:hypothetical protein
MNLRIAKKLGGCLMALTLAIGCVSSVAVTADETDSKLSVSSETTGSISDGYTTSITVPTNDGEPFKVYSIYFTGNGGFKVSAANSGTFSNGVWGGAVADPSSSSLTSVQYTVNDDATAEGVAADLSALVYQGEGSITITAAKYKPADGDVYFNGHYYRMSQTTAQWSDAMKEMQKGDTESYPGYKGHPITVTSTAENEMLINLLKKSCGHIWIGMVPSDANDYSVDGKLPNAGYSLGLRGGNGKGWIWIWDTPEAGDEVVSGTQYWSSVQPDGGPSYVVYIGFNSTTQWDDLSSNYVYSSSGLGVSNYVTEYSPWDSESGEWVYDADGNSATCETGSFDKVQSVTRTFSGANAAVSCEEEALTGLEPNTEYTISAGDDVYTITTGDDGKIALSSDSYDLAGKEITIKKSGEGSIAQTLTVPGRATAEFDIGVEVTTTSIAIDRAKDGYEYSIDGVNWAVYHDGDERIVYSGLMPYTTYTIYFRVAATETTLASTIEKINPTTDCEHTGGVATCHSLAICTICGEEYGDYDLNNHENMMHVVATASTATSDGNTEYWYCQYCDKYFSDEAATKEISKADTVIAKIVTVSPSPAQPITTPAAVQETSVKAVQTGDDSNLILWVSLMLIGCGVVALTTVKGKKKISK